MRPIDADAFKRENKDLLQCDFPHKCEETLEELIDAAPTIESPEQKWIPCSERLPESHETVLISTELGIYVAWTTDDGLNLWHTATIPFSGEEVFAWMPLPEPYKEEKDNG